MQAGATFGERLAQAILADGRDQQDIAKAVGEDDGQLSRWKKGRAVPDLPKVAKLVLELGISGHWLLTGEGDMRLPTGDEPLRLQVIGRIADGGLDAEAIRRIADAGADVRGHLKSAATPEASPPSRPRPQGRGAS